MEQTNAIGSVRVGNITVNLHNVGYYEVLDSTTHAAKDAFHWIGILKVSENGLPDAESVVN